MDFSLSPRLSVCRFRFDRSGRTFSGTSTSNPHHSNFDKSMILNCGCPSSQMDSSPNCTLGVAIDIRSHREGVRDAIRRHPRCIWTVCAATSILTSRHLYRSASLNYPVQIHLLQLITVAIYLAWTSIRHQQRKRSTLLQANKTSWTFLIILGSVMSLSVGFTLQAVLHMPNTTTLVMLTVSKTRSGHHRHH